MKFSELESRRNLSREKRRLTILNRCCTFHNVVLPFSISNFLDLSHYFARISMNFLFYHWKFQYISVHSFAWPNSSIIMFAFLYRKVYTCLCPKFGQFSLFVLYAVLTHRVLSLVFCVLDCSTNFFLESFYNFQDLHFYIFFDVLDIKSFALLIFSLVAYMAKNAFCWLENNILLLSSVMFFSVLLIESSCLIFFQFCFRSKL